MEKTFKGNDFTATFSTNTGSYFSFTGNFNGVSGVIGAKLAEDYPMFKPLADMHLSGSITGEPMHALENGFYWLETAIEKTKSWEQAFQALENYWRVKLTPQQKNRIAGKCNHAEEKPARICSCNDQDRNGQPLWEDTKNAVKAVMEEIRPIWRRQAEEAKQLADELPADMYDDDPNFNPEDSFDEPDKARALAQHLGCSVSSIEEVAGRIYSAEGKEFTIYTDDEADRAWNEALDNYLDECVYPELPENMINYFDDEAWKRDAQMDGRGHALNRYDGVEYMEKVSGEYYYLYREN